MNKPTCFIAMAFGYDDTDEYYEKLVLPVLKRNNIMPVIINRRQSNDDLNFQIFEQLKKADFCIADLTYTRPSVYFEAGFAERKIPVIYTVRKDHLDRSQPDDRRVHFDLQMKPILSWSTSEDKDFSRRLEKRLIATILKEWIKNKKIIDKTAEEIKNFNHQSLDTRLFQARKYTVKFLESLGLKPNSWVLPYDVKTKKALLELDFIRATVQKKKEGIFVALESHDSITQQVLKNIKVVNFYNLSSLNHFRNTERTLLINKLTTNHIVLSLKPIKANAIEKMFDSFTPVIRTKVYKFSAPVEVFNKEKIDYTVNLFFVSDINSLSQLANELNGTFSEFIKKQLA